MGGEVGANEAMIAARKAGGDWRLNDWSVFRLF